MALEQQIKSAIEAATSQLAAQFQERLQSLAAELSEAASAGHARELEAAVARATADLTSQHEAALAALRAETAEQRDLAVSMAGRRPPNSTRRRSPRSEPRLRSQQQAAVEALRAEHGVGASRAPSKPLRAELAAQHERRPCAALRR